MKQYSFLIILHTLLIGAFSIGIYLLAKEQLWFSALVVMSFLLITVFNLYRMQTQHITLMKRLTESIRFNDLTQTYVMPMKSKLMQEMSHELTGSLQQLKSRLLEDEVRHQYYESLLDKVDTAVIVIERSGQVEWMNRAAHLLWKDRSQMPEVLAAAMMPDIQIVQVEKDGQTLEMAVSSTVFSAQGKERLLISFKNIHSVLERNEMDAWQKLIRVLTHEIMNSITPILSLSETLGEREIPVHVTEKEYKIMHQAMQTIQRRSKGLLDFVENYRRLTRLPVPVLTEVPVKELFSDLRKLFPDHYITFELKHPDIILKVDRTQIEQVLINLIKNSKEATAVTLTPQIRIWCEKNNVTHQIIFNIRDNGEGILPEVIDKVFVPFFTTKQTGSGIGLSLCKQIMNQHRGSIFAVSEFGKGSCFTLVFPTGKVPEPSSYGHSR